jgi:2-polyprenyl-3-methyl-5-hydroxy-6-metoxy-1,4-benzoquinol methylase
MEAMRCLKRDLAAGTIGCSATDQYTLAFPKSEPFTDRRRTMSATRQFDEDASRRVERIYTTPDVIEQRQTILRALALQPGERAIDIGSGPGLLACEMAVAVGTGGRICGVDVAVCTQVYEYVDDVPAALLELGRVLRPGGRALVLDTDWDSIVWASSDNERMDRVLAAWEEHLVHPHLPRTLTRLLRDAGLEITDRQIVPLFNAGYDPNTYSAGSSTTNMPFADTLPMHRIQIYLLNGERDTSSQFPCFA